MTDLVKIRNCNGVAQTTSCCIIYQVFGEFTDVFSNPKAQ